MSFLFRHIGKILCLLVLLWLGAFFSFAYDIEVHSPDAAQKSDGIVILTGTTDRLTAGFELLKSGVGVRLLISGVNSQISRETLRQAIGESDAVMTCCVDLGRLAKDTVGNAYETALWAEENKFKSLLVVTSSYHIPRSLVELKRQMPDLTLRPFAVHDEKVPVEKWWKNPRVTYILAAEFNKYLFSLFRARLEAYVMNGAST
jgi:uncharacterized SAM-binding protein YcdF (DUF218 family)